MRIQLALLGLLALAATPAQPSRAAGAPPQSQASSQALGLHGAISAPGGANVSSSAAVAAKPGAGGSQISTSASPALPALGAPGLTSPSPNLSPIDADAAADDCRLSCAHSYYFCLSSPDAGDCADTWRACLQTCGPSSPGA